jgi:hypothetical protein
VAVRDSTHVLLIQQGYKLIDDAWTANRRLTYGHNDDANREFITNLAKVLQSAGWHPHPTYLRAFCHQMVADGIIEIEPGGSETSGHFLHYMNAD